jgi:hypothetical protein
MGVFGAYPGSGAGALVNPFAGTTAAESAAGVTPATPSLYDECDVRRYGANVGSGGDDTTAINNCLAVAAKAGRPAMLAGLVLNSTGGHIRDAALCGVEGKGARIIAPTTGTNIAWQDTCSGSGSSGNVRHVSHPMRDLTVSGSATGDGYGHVISASAEPAAAFLNYNNVVFEGFNIAGQVGSNAYILKFFGCYYSRSSTGFLLPQSISNAAEQVDFFGGGFTDNSSVAFDNQNGNTDVVLHGCSIDGNNIIYYRGDHGSRTYMRDCHIEILNGPNQSITPIQVLGNNCILDFEGGAILADGTVPFPYDSIFNIGSGAKVILGSGLLLNNLRNTAGVLCTGTGTINIRNGETATYQSANLPAVVGASSNFSLLADGAFAQASVKDNIAITSDTATITSRVTGTNISLAIGTNGATPCLVATKVGGVGTAAGFGIIVPCQPGQRMAVKGQYAASTSLTNNLFLYGGFAILTYGASGVPLYQNFSLQSGANVTSLSTTFVDFTAGQFVAPPWANCFFLNCNLNGMAAASFYLTNLFINGM